MLPSYAAPSVASEGSAPAAEAVVRVPRKHRSAPWGARIAIAFLVLIILACVLAPLIAPDSPLATSISARLQGPSLRHLLGTDSDGRDVLSRVLYGGRSAFEGVGIALLGTIVIGIPWGLVAGLTGGFLDEALMRVADTVLSFPALVLAIAITGVLGPSLITAMLAISVVFGPIVARLLRTAVLPLRDAEFVLVARSLGIGRARIALQHILPNAMAPVLVQLFSLASLALIIEAALAFLGLGVHPPAPSWGADLAQAYSYFTVTPLGTVVPGLIITVSALAISVTGDYVRSVLR